VLDLSRFSSNAPPILDVVQELVDRSLLRTWTHRDTVRHDVGEPHFGLFVSIRDYAAEKLRAVGVFPGSGSAGEREAWSRHGAFYALLGTEEALAALRSHGGTSRRRTLHDELDNLVTACRRAIDRGDGRVAVDTALASTEALLLQGPFQPAEELTTAVAAMSDLELDDAFTIGQARARALGKVGRHTDAIAAYEGVLERARAANRLRVVTTVHGNLGSALRLVGDADGAMRHIELALEAHRSLDDPSGRGAVRYTHGVLLAHLGRSDDALEAYAEALEVSVALGDRRDEAVIRGSMGSLCADQGRGDEALVHFRDALGTAREIGYEALAAMLMTNIGNVLSTRGKNVDALGHYASAVRIHEQMGNKRHAAIALINIGVAYHLQGRLSDAIAQQRRAARALDELEDPVLGGASGMLLAAALHVVGLTDQAVAELDSAIAKLDGANNAYYLQAALTTRATVAIDVGQLADAEQDLERASELADTLGAVGRRAAVSHARGRLAIERGLTEEGLALLKESYQGAREAQDRSLELGVLVEWAAAVANKDDTRRALELIDEALALARHTGDVIGLAGALVVHARMLRVQDPTRSAALGAEARGRMDAMGLLATAPMRKALREI
jgi:tetratricopeptide (TPR) repeat protein